MLYHKSVTLTDKHDHTDIGSIFSTTTCFAVYISHNQLASVHEKSKKGDKQWRKIFVKL